MVMPPGDALGDVLYANAADPRHGTGEVLLHQLLAETDCLEDLRGLVGLDRRNTHLRGDLYDTAQHGLVVVLDRGMVILIEDADVDHLRDALMGEVRVDGTRTEAEDGRELMDIARLARLEDQGHGGPLLRLDEVLLDGAHRQQGWNRHVVLVDSTIAQDDDVVAALVCTIHRDIELLQGLLEGGILIVEKRDHLGPEARLVEVLDLHKLDAREDRVLHLEHAAVVRLILQQITIGADVDGRIRDDLLAEGVDRRVRNLCEELLEVVEQQLVLLAEYRKRDIVAHRRGLLDAVLRHREDHGLHVLVAVAEDLIEAVTHLLRVRRDLPVRDLQVLDVKEVPVEPLTVRLTCRIGFLALLVRDDALRLRVDEQHTARLESGLLHDVLRINV